MRKPFVCSFLLCVLQACAGSPFGALTHAADEQVVREQRTVIVDEAKEKWQLVWDGKPSTVCGPDEVYMAITCPCSGWAYAEYGKLFLVRSRGGHEIERVDLRPLFGMFDYPEARPVGSELPLVGTDPVGHILPFWLTTAGPQSSRSSGGGGSGHEAKGPDLLIQVIRS